MFLKIIFTVLFVLLNSFLFWQLQKKRFNNFKEINSITLLVIVILTTYCFFRVKESTTEIKIFIVGFIYSFSLVFFYFIFKIIRSKMKSRYEKFNSKFIEGYIKVLDFIETKLLFILMTIFQLLLIWDSSVIEGMNF